MTAIISREEADKIGSDFEKIASREEKKATTSSIKVVITIVTVLLILLFILAYYYLKGPLANKSAKTPSSVNSQESLVANQGPQMPQPLFGGEPINVSGRQLLPANE